MARRPSDADDAIVFVGCQPVALEERGVEWRS